MYEKTKRKIDLLLTLCALPLVVLVSCLVAAYIFCVSPGPVLHWSRRVGRDNVGFLMAKFRTMKLNTPQVATHLMTDPNQYLIPGGKYLRKLSLDELPQLIHVLNGELSLVGPRPALYNQDDLIEARTERGIHRIQPGITGLAQVSGRDELDIPTKVEYDFLYLNRRSLMLDIRILAITLSIGLFGVGVSH